MATGDIWISGYGGQGTLDNSSTANVSVPQVVNVRNNFVSLGDDIGMSSMAIDSTGKALVWGQNSNGQLGNNTTDNTSVPVSVVDGLMFTKVDEGSYHAIGLDDNGALERFWRGEVSFPIKF